jgi:NAD(P)-dependent dehydrogenase (short-subunit alcohol dehydrogenase family)
MFAISSTLRSEGVMSQILVVGGTSGIGRKLAEHYVAEGCSVVVAGRTAERARKVAADIQATYASDTGGVVRGIAVDVSQPGTLRDALSDIDSVDSLVLAGMQRDQNSLREYDIDSASTLATAKVIGYTTVAHILQPRMSGSGSVLVFGGVSKDMPYPGSTTISAVNAAMVGLTATLAVEMAPIRVNAIHPGAVGDSPFWADKEGALEPVRRRTLTGRLPTMQDIVDGSVFLLENPSANGVNLSLNGGLA